MNTSQLEEDIEINPPEGFILSESRGPFSLHNGPFFHKIDTDRFYHGLRIQRRHCNIHGILHGGLIGLFLDGLLGASIGRATDRNSVTIRLTTDYLDMGKVGEWLEGTADLTRATTFIAFASGRIYVGKRTIATASGVYKLMKNRERPYRGT